MQLVAAVAQASVLDIFKSRQGEGPCVGDPQIFVRFGGCNLVCDYCDTPESIPAHSGRRTSVEEVLAKIASLLPSREKARMRDGVEQDHPSPQSSPLKGEEVRVVSLTGGEPLLHLDFLQELIPRLRGRGYRIYLETNGTLPKALEKVIDLCDWVAMDFKPRTATGRDLWEAHRWFLETGGKKVFVKMVLTGSTEEAEFRRGVELVAAVRPETPLILQPATAWGTARSIPLARLASWWAWASGRLTDVRIIPQVHRLWEIA
jgi:7-carboxy-7-deazaguanine synthase